MYRILGEVRFSSDVGSSRNRGLLDELWMCSHSTTNFCRNRKLSSQTAFISSFVSVSVYDLKKVLSLATVLSE